MNVLGKMTEKSLINPLQGIKKAVLLPSQLRQKAVQAAISRRLESFLKKKILKRVAGLKIVCNFAAPNDNKGCCLAKREFFELMEQYEK